MEVSVYQTNKTKVKINYFKTEENEVKTHATSAIVFSFVFKDVCTKAFYNIVFFILLLQSANDLSMSEMAKNIAIINAHCPPHKRRMVSLWFTQHHLRKFREK